MLHTPRTRHVCMHMHMHMHMHMRMHMRMRMQRLCCVHAA